MTLAIVPAYNEASMIGSVVRSLFQHVDRVVVVDDGSGDNTASVARQAGATVLRHELNRGQGAAIETGHEYARGVGADYVVHFDADGQFDANDISGAIAALAGSGADILFGSRFLDSRSAMPFTKRVVILPFARMVQRMLTGVRLSDAHNGFRILNAKAIREIRLTQDAMAHATEILALAKKRHLRHIEYPVKVVYREYGQGAFGGARVLADLFLEKFVK
jgi:glycosyltransferase involved in cell wall biosynthesis